VHERLFTLPDDTRVWPAHDYRGNTVSTIGYEKRHNARLVGRDRRAFIELMGNLKLPRPKMIDVAVPANQLLGIPHAA
jgi:glyoxylase-like metal-dependent hydrolase (beta-lactamase superfamily II)